MEIHILAFFLQEKHLHVPSKNLLIWNLRVLYLEYSLGDWSCSHSSPVPLGHGLSRLSKTRSGRPLAAAHEFLSSFMTTI